MDRKKELMNIFDQIEKPTLLLNPETARRNLARINFKAQQHGVRFRPHFKTHQSAEIGDWYRTEGITAITTSSVDMARYFANHGWKDILIAFPVNLRQINSINQLAREIHLELLVESAETASFLGKRLESPVDVWIKIDVGNGRTGLDWDNPDPIHQVALEIHKIPKMSLRGLLTHAGHTYQATSPDQVCEMYEESVCRINHARYGLSSSGVEYVEVTVGDTPGSSLCEPGMVDEIRPGNFIFYDSQQLHVGACHAEDIAVAVACPVVALHPERQEIVIYGGAIHLSKDFLVENEHRAYGYIALPEGEGWGKPLKGAYVRGLSQEHGMVHLDQVDISRLKIGDLVCILPAHSCLTVQAMKEYLTLDGKVIATLN
jgi:D-serine deaminase-like pyridoxal phosphate-dependent protein